MQANETQAALNEQAELLRAKYGLPEGDAQFGQGPEGWSIVVTPAEKPEPVPTAGEPEPKVEEAPCLH